MVVTSGGLIGKITKAADDNEVELEIAPNVRVRLARSGIADVRSKGEPVKDAAARQIAGQERRAERLNACAIAQTVSRCSVSRPGRSPPFWRSSCAILLVVPSFLAPPTRRRA